MRAAMEQFFTKIEQDVDNVSIASPYDAENARQVSRDGTIAYAELQFKDRESADYQDAADRIIELRDEVKVDGLRVELGNQIFSKQEFGSEAVGLLLAMIILLVAFGSLLAAGLPIATALVGIGCGVAIVQLVANGLNMPDFTTQAVLMISIGVGIDYALFIVTRYREALESGRDPESAVVVALDTAGRAVLFAGSTVVIALLGLLVLNTETFRGVAIGTAHRRAGDDARLGDAPPRTARLRRSQHRPLRSPPPQAARRTATRSGTGGPRCPEAALAGVPGRARPADRDGAPGVLDAARLRRLGQQAQGRHEPGGLRPPREGLRSRASTDRCCSRPRRPVARPTSRP